jgi:hypothetical protein
MLAGSLSNFQKTSVPFSATPTKRWAVHAVLRDIGYRIKSDAGYYAKDQG